MTKNQINTKYQIPVKKIINLVFGIWPLFRHWWLVFGVLSLAFFLRIWKVGSYPPLLWDEAALGYNAYSILKTGRDEYGKWFPLIFRSFGDYKPGLYVYLSVPFVAIFGLNELAVRLPSVILGSATPLILFLLVENVFGDPLLGLLSAAVLAFLPWSVHFSRGAWEVNVMTFFLALGSYLLLKNSKTRLLAPKQSDGGQAQVKSEKEGENEKWKVKKERWKRILGLVCFLLALTTYQGAKMMVPLILGGIMILRIYEYTNIEYKGKKENDQTPITNLPACRQAGWYLLFGILFLWWYLASFTGPARNRLRVMSLFSYRRPAGEIVQILKEEGKTKKDLHFYLFHGEWLSFLRGVLVRYFNHFSPRFLSFEGDWSNPRHSAPYFGVIGHINFVFFLVGLGYFLSQRHKPREYFFLYWLLVAPLPAAFSRDIISAVRAFPMVVPIAFFVANGILRIYEYKFRIYEYTNIEYKGKNKKYQKPTCPPNWRVTKDQITTSDQRPNNGLGNLEFRMLLALGIFVLAMADFLYWWDLYWRHMIKRRPREWLLGYKEAIAFAEHIVETRGNFCGNCGNSCGNIIFTDKLGQPHIFWAFCTKMDPKIYQKEVELIENQYGDVGKVERLGCVEFRGVNWEADKNLKNTILIGTLEEIPKNAAKAEFGNLRIYK